MVSLFKRLFASSPVRRRRKKKKSLQEKYPRYEIGRGTYGDLRVDAWGEGATLRIGAFCSFADGVQIFLGGDHRVDWVTTYPFNVFWDAAKQIKGHPKTKGNVAIGNDVWVGREAVILSGVTVGDGAVVGTRAVVTEDVPPYAIAVGVPARLVKKRFDDETIRRLLRLQWWHWEDDRIRKALPLLLSSDVKAFLEAAENGEF
jgi:acetyltransferase-like isoleucine patch superfamily enzyme